MSIKDHSYRIEGGRVGVLLIHGLCGTPTEMRYVANGLARQGYTVHCPQLAGHCGTEEDLKNSTWRDWYRSAEQGLQEILKTCDTVIVGGLSTGALLGVLLAARHPDKVQALALFSPTLWLTGWQIPWYVKFFNVVTTRRLANLFRFPAPHRFGIKDARIREFIRNALKVPGGPALPVNTPGAAVLERRWLVKEVTKVVPHIVQPTLIIHPREDDYAGLDNAFYLQKTLPGKVEMVVLEDSYHIVTIDRQRDVVVERTQSFIGRIFDALGADWQKADLAAARNAA